MKNRKTLAFNYFIIVYITTILLTRPSLKIEKYRGIIWIIPFLIWVSSYMKMKMFNDKSFLIWEKATKKFNVYIIIFIITMIFTNLISINIKYSLISSIFSVLLLFIMFKVIGSILIQTETNYKIKSYITVQLVLIHIIAIVGDSILKLWQWDSTGRFSGGVNPNMMSLIALFSFSWFFDGYIDEKNNHLNHLGISLSIVVLFLTLSRGRILSFLVLLTFILVSFTLLFLTKYIKSKIKIRTIKIVLILLVLLLVLLPPIINKILVNEVIIARVFNPLTSRLNTWEFLKDIISENVLFGKLGWWNANDILKENAFGTLATSAHNFYLRTIAEVGIIGLSIIILLPICLFYRTFIKAFENSNITKNHRKKLLLYSGLILALFVSQIAEDQYLQGIGDFQTGIFAWTLALAHFNLVKDKIFDDEKELSK